MRHWQVAHTISNNSVTSTSTLLRSFFLLYIRKYFRLSRLWNNRVSVYGLLTPCHKTSLLSSENVSERILKIFSFSQAPAGSISSLNYIAGVSRGGTTSLSEHKNMETCLYTASKKTDGWRLDKKRKKENFTDEIKLFQLEHMMVPQLMFLFLCINPRISANLWIFIYFFRLRILLRDVIYQA